MHTQLIAQIRTNVSNKSRNSLLVDAHPYKEQGNQIYGWLPNSRFFNKEHCVMKQYVCILVHYKMFVVLILLITLFFTSSENKIIFIVFHDYKYLYFRNSCSFPKTINMFCLKIVLLSLLASTLVQAKPKCKVEKDTNFVLKNMKPVAVKKQVRYHAFPKNGSPATCVLWDR